MKPASPKAVRARLLEYVNRPHDEEANSKPGIVVAKFNEALAEAYSTVAGADARRYLVWGFCFGKPEERLHEIRSADLTTGQIFALKKWIGSHKIMDEWTERAEFVYEARWVLALCSTLLHLQDEPNYPLLGEFLAGLTEYQMDAERGMPSEIALSLGGVPQEIAPDVEDERKAATLIQSPQKFESDLEFMEI